MRSSYHTADGQSWLGCPVYTNGVQRVIIKNKNNSIKINGYNKTTAVAMALVLVKGRS
jgi:hypothetical protein